MLIRKLKQQLTGGSRSFNNVPSASLSPSVDVTALKIDKLNTETGDVEETLILNDTHIPFSPFQFKVEQDVMKYYYPGGPPDRRPTIQIIGSMDEDVTVTGRLKATKLKNTAQQGEPLQYANILERFVREGKPCKFQIGFYIKFVVLKDIRFDYRTNNDIGYHLTFVVLGNENPITGEASKEEQTTTDKVFETESDDDISNEVQEFENEIIALKQEMRMVGYDYPVRRGGIPGFLDTLFDTVDEVENIINSANEVVTDFASEIDKTVQRIEKSLTTVRRLRSRLYRVQTQLYGSYLRIKRFSVPLGSSNPRRVQDALTAGNAVQNFINNFHLSLKKSEDSMTIQYVSFLNKTYVVQAGDTWQNIAVRFYNDYTRWQEIKDINQGELTANRIIIIPR